jgi:hypothetical protein
MAELITALTQLKRHWEAGEYRKALKLAAGWPKLGEHRDAIKTGWEAAARPNLYAQMGKDPAALEAAGLAAVAARYGLPAAK